MKKQNLILFFMSLFIMLQTEAKVISDTIMNTPIGKVQVQIKTSGYSGYGVEITEVTKLLPNPRDCGPFEERVVDFQKACYRSFIPLFKKTYSQLYELVNSGLLYKTILVLKCNEHGALKQGFVLAADSQNIEYLTLFVRELTKDSRFLAILKKSASDALKEVPASRPFEKLPDWAKQEIKEKKADYYWNFLIKIDKETLDKY